MKQDNNHNFEAKWTRPIAKSGYTNIPNLLIENQANLEITNGEMVVLIGLLKHRWTTSNPYPSVGTLSKHSGMAQQTIRKHLRCLERKKILKRVFREGLSSEYDFRPLISKLGSYTQAKPNPAQKRATPYPKVRGSPYSKMDTKEDAVKKTKRKRPTGNGGKVETEQIGSILGRQAKRLGVKL